MTEEIKLRSNRKNLTGQKFGKLTVIKPVKTINDTSRWLCKCECGNEKVVATYRLLSGRVTTCGDCFNTINFYIPEILRLEQERDELKKTVENQKLEYEELQCDLSEVENACGCYQSENAELKQENKELKEYSQRMENQRENYYKEYNKYRSALEEIRENLVKLKTNDEDDFTYEYSKIEDKINEFLNLS